MHKPAFKAVIFDMDGTLTVPALDFNTIREELGIPTGDIVKVIESWPEKKREAAWLHIELHEAKVIRLTRFQPDVRETLLFFRDLGIYLGILTRNSSKSTKIVLDMLDVKFDAVLTRDYPYIKPDPTPVFHILDKWGVEPAETLVVGDYIHDIECANSAGAASCFFKNEGIEVSYANQADYTVKNYRELKDLVLNGRPENI